LWLGYGTWDSLVKILKSKFADWEHVKYIVFDLPTSQEPYERRMENLHNLSLPKHVSISSVMKCESQEHLQNYLNSILTAGGEGLVAREPGSLYISGRTESFLKLKVDCDIILLNDKDISRCRGSSSGGERAGNSFMSTVSSSLQFSNVLKD
jgi:ATP-dependent DNA ligase